MPLLLACALLAACASAPSREAPVAAAPPTAATPAVLPGADLLRASERVELTGRELGTMWTFENPPLEYWEERYDFSPDAEWLEHVRLSSVRFGTFCSASFVSPDGLVMTNHHCARGCVEEVSTEQNDYVVDGFLARRPAQEKLCPGLYLDQLAEIEDVTDRVQDVALEGMTDREVTDAQEAMRTTIEEECEAVSDFECQVVTLFHGGQFQLYKYRRYQPVKLVMAPELQAGFFGGDPDNFTYPRYALDVSFVRAYQPDSITPANTPHHFEWDPQGAQEGELVLITGNPGSTSRFLTVSQVMVERNVRHPLLVDLFTMRSEQLRDWASRGADEEREVRDELFGVENSLKAFTGQLGGLQDTIRMARKIRWEQEFRERVRADPELRREYGDVWDRIAALQPRIMELRPRVWLYSPGFFPSQHTELTALLLEYAEQMALPEADRSDPFRGDALDATVQRLREARPELERSIPTLATRLELARRFMPDDGVLSNVTRPGESAEQAARRILNGSRVGEPAFRSQLIDAGPAAIEAADDPLVSLVRNMRRAFDTSYEAWQEVTAREAVQEERLAMALFGAYGTSLPPDATFTLRISDGVVAGYPYNGTIAPPHTTFYGMYDRAFSHNQEMPWTLPDSFRDAIDTIDMATPFNFVSTNDITGGNSGSPMIDRDARVVGIAFDGNIEQLPNEFLWSSERARTVAVHSAGILEALRAVYAADELVAELLGQPLEWDNE